MKSKLGEMKEKIQGKRRLLPESQGGEKRPSREKKPLRKTLKNGEKRNTSNFAWKITSRSRKETRRGCTACRKKKTDRAPAGEESLPRKKTQGGPLIQETLESEKGGFKKLTLFII